MKQKISYLILLLTAILMVGCTNVVEDSSFTDEKTEPQEVTQEENSIVSNKINEKEDNITTDKSVEEENNTTNESVAEKKPAQSKDELFAGYKLIEVNACDLSGHREPNAVVNIGFGNRDYFAFTNEFGQLVRVIADEIILQDDRTEQVTSSGRYCRDEAKVPGVESKYLDEGHVIADSMGAVSNSYNITPQNSTLNRHGDQAYMENAIRKAGGATNFEAIITYPNTKTQIPSKYKFTYTIKGNTVTDEFENVNPDEVNESLGLTGSKPSSTPSSIQEGDISSIDTNGNGIVTIKEAKDAGFSMPVTKSHWLYQYMHDADGDGVVGE